jgi:hypothetical protein
MKYVQCMRGDSNADRNVRVPMRSVFSIASSKAIHHLPTEGTVKFLRELPKAH